MAIYDNDGTSDREIGKLYDNNGTTNFQIGKAYDNDGASNHLIYSAEETYNWSLNVQQGTSKQWGTKTMTVQNSCIIKNIVITPGKSYGRVQNIFVICQAGYADINHVVKNFYNKDNYYNINGWWTEPNTVTINETYTISPGQIIFFQVGASYDPNISGSHTSTGSVSFTLE